MNLKRFANAAALFIGLGLVAFQFNKGSQQQSTIKPPAAEEEKQQKFERWQLKLGSIYDGDTLRVVRGNEELKIRFCGIDAPERDQELGIESRDNLQSLVDMGNGELLIVPIEQDKYGRTVAEVYVQDRKDSAINLNLQMIREGYAWLYGQYADNCPSAEHLVLAERLAQEEGLGIHSGNYQVPWEWRKANK